MKLVIRAGKATPAHNRKINSGAPHDFKVGGSSLHSAVMQLITLKCCGPQPSLTESSLPKGEM